MLIPRFGGRLRASSPRILGTLGCVLALLGAVSCGKKEGTPNWDTPGDSPPPPIATTAAVQASAVPASPRTQSAKPAPVAAGDPATAGLRFVTYNVENWLTMDRYVDRKQLKGAAKPETEKHAVIQMLTRHAPDVIGVCEIGTPDDLKEIQTLLKAGGLDLPHSHYTGGSDPVRHLGLLSRFPITSTVTPGHLEFTLNGTHFAMNRGIMDASITAHGKSYRFLGVHLKSKREVDEGDQEALRQNEARLLRQHIDSILSADPAARLVVYGDFNDTWGSPSLKTIVGSFNHPSYLTAIRANDSAGVRWTHYWELHDIYSRFDFIAVSQPLKREVDFNSSHIIDDPEWKDASDHRPVMAIFK